MKTVSQQSLSSYLVLLAAFLALPTTDRPGFVNAFQSVTMMPTTSSWRQASSSSLSPSPLSSRRIASASFLSPGATTTSSTALFADANDRDQEIERLKSMAAKLRAEAAALEAEQAQIQAQAAERLFQKFDINQDGEISLAELKAGLEKSLKTELSERRVQKLLENFDKSGDGALQLDEFATVEQLRNKLDAIARDEKQAALELSKKAKQEQEAVQFLQAQMEILNDRPPTAADKIISILPYLFPLLDGFQFARFLVLENPDNPVSIAIAILYALYRAIPFGGFIAFFALSFLSGNPTINRLIRFNMQQAIFLDVALFFPGLIAAVNTILLSGVGGIEIPQWVDVLGSDLVFVTLLAAIGYATVSSLLGITPDKIPLIGNAVNSRMPTMDMFDAQGRFLGRRSTDSSDETTESTKKEEDKDKTKSSNDDDKDS